MAARAMWQGVLGFGMVSVPVKLFVAASSEDLSFNQLHAAGPDGQPCLQRVKQPKECPIHGKIEQASIIRGYEYEKDKYITISDAELATLPLASKDNIVIAGFVPTEQVDPLYYEKSYYLAPGKGGNKAFALIVRAMALTGLTAIASITVRKKEQLCAVRVANGVLVLTTLFYPSEVRVELDKELPEVSDAELKLATTLMGAMTQAFDPEQYVDHYQQALQELITAKLTGATLPALPAPEPSLDLAAALQSSLKALPSPAVEVHTKVPVAKKVAV